MAVMSGMSYEDAWDATPREAEVMISAYHKRMSHEAWLHGMYVMAAIGSCLSTKTHYPDNPSVEETIVDPDMDLTEEEKEYYRKLFHKRMGEMNNGND